MMPANSGGASRATRLLRRVSARQRIVLIGRRWHVFALALAGAYGLAFLSSRLLALLPNRFPLPTLLAVPLVALLVAVLVARRPRATDVAHLVDAHASTHDLFLTRVLLDTACGEFKPIVVEQAEERARTVEPRRVVPFRWQRKAGETLAAMAALLLAILFLPQFDPFGKEKKRAHVAQLRRELEETKKATELRLALVEKSNPTAKTSEEVTQAVEALKLTFNTMKPREQKANLQRLTEAQKNLGDLWKKLSEDRLQNSFEQDRQLQRLGAGKGQQIERWKAALQRGDTSELRKELDDIKQKAAELQQAPDSAEKREKEQQLRQQLKTVADFLANNASSKALQQSTQRALDQLALGQNPELSKEATEALQKSLEAMGMDLEAAGQAVRDLQQLEQALKAAQLGRLANQRSPLDGENCGGCQNMGDYADFFKKLMEGAEQVQPGGGMGDYGIGEGGVAPEKDSVKTDFTPERSKSALHAGKILLQWKTQEVSDPGKARELYRQRIEAVKQGVSEAILQERVPPGYHDAIKRYFDTLSESRAAGQPPPKP